jgi:hypothetical protein
LALKSPAALHTLASARILWITDLDKGVAPSKTMLLRCLYKHQQTNGVAFDGEKKSSRTSVLESKAGRASMSSGVLQRKASVA